MGKKSTFRKLVQAFDESELRSLISLMEEGFNKTELLEIAESVADLRPIPDAEQIATTVSAIVDADRMEFFSNCGPTPYGYVDSMDYAYDWIVDHLRAEFRETADILKARSMDEDLDSMMLAIADSLDEAYGLLRDESPDACEQLANHIRQCVEEGEPLEGFDW